ncbi:MAG: hypothetical protein H9Q66_05680, partial [Spiroplasma ixodetis]|nr:hypothetical protein [Spiroplasma ixodetis]
MGEEVKDLAPLNGFREYRTSWNKVRLLTKKPYLGNTIGGVRDLIKVFPDVITKLRESDNAFMMRLAEYFESEESKELRWNNSTIKILGVWYCLFQLGLTTLIELESVQFVGTIDEPVQIILKACSSFKILPG